MITILRNPTVGAETLKVIVKIDVKNSKSKLIFSVNSKPFNIKIKECDITSFTSGTKFNNVRDIDLNMTQNFTFGVVFPDPKCSFRYFASSDKNDFYTLT